jgi:hypothetical protein
MKKKLIMIVFLMLLTTTIVSATTTNGEETTPAIASETIVYQPTLFDWWGVDQEQTENCGHGLILTTPWTYAQSFTPTKEKLTAVRLYLFKYGAPPDPVYITVSIRANLTEADLATKTIDTSKISIGSGTKAKWVLFDFKDITLTPGNKYFIVCSGGKGDETNAYCWFYNNQDTYTGGEAWIKPDETSVWANFTHGGFNPDDYCFKTYFKKPFGGSIANNNEITLPSSYTRPMLLFWEQFIERFPNAFPVLRYL